MFKKNILILLPILLGTANLLAQEVWSLEKCVQYALENSLNIKQADLGVQQSELTLDGNRYARLPNLSASSSYGYQFGRTIDPTSNSFINASTGSNTWQLNSSVMLYNGGRITKSIQQADYDLEAAKSDAQQTQNDIALNVANAYLNILFSEEQLNNAQTRIQLTKAQLEQTEKLIRAGQIPENDKYDILANIARNEQAIVVQQNNVDMAYLNLKQLLELDPSMDLSIERPVLEIPPSDLSDLSLETVYSTALNTQPFIVAGNLRLKSAEMGVDIAKSSYYPRLSLFGSIDTRYASKAQQQVGTGTVVVPQSILAEDLSATIDITGTSQTANLEAVQGTIGFVTEVPVRGAYPYFDQLNDNLGQTVGLSLSIPIYNNHQTKLNVERAKLNILNTQLTNQRNKQQLKTNIQTAIANAKAARLQLQAAEQTREAFRIAYENAQKRLDLGAINTFQLVSAQNNLDTSEVDYIVAKYDYLFKLKIVEFYQGKQIRL